jgi:N6-adenosine-specific RNA methylase IME4
LSPFPECGKSRALEATGPLVCRLVGTVNPSANYLFRKAGDPEGPVTVLFDEIDTFFGREIELAAKQTALPNKRYGVIYADPEWRFEVYSRETGMDCTADNHYPTSPLEEICNRPVGDIAADDCVLFLWATVPMARAAFRVMESWGFEYKSQFVWVKNRIGTGYWNRNKHEILLIGTKGNVPAPAPGTQWPSAIEAPVGRHSEKPEKFYELIEGYFPNLPKIELNARRSRPGWDAWGNEVMEAAQ